MDRESVFSYINACDAVIVPSRWEGFGLIAIEGMRAGKAIIVSNRGALPEIVDQHTGLTFDIENERLAPASAQQPRPCYLAANG